MGRMTRAKAAEVAGMLHVHEDALLEPPCDNPEMAGQVNPDGLNRKPLGEISGNIGISEDNDNEMGDIGGAVKSKKVMEQNVECQNETSSNYTSLAQAGDRPGEVMPDSVESVPSPASEAAAEDLMKDAPLLEMSHLPVHDTRPTTPPSSAVRLTRSQLEITSPELNDHFNDSVACPAEALNDDEQMPSTVQRLRDSPVEVVATPKQNTDHSMSSPTISETIYDRLETAVIESGTPPRSTSKPSPDAISALDELDDAVEKIAAQVPEVQNSPQKPKAKSQRPVPAVRTTKASQARISLAHGPKDTPRAPAMGRPRQSLAMSQTDSKRITSTSSIKSNDSTTDAPAEKKEIVIPHSKPRPFSMSFPTPPPPPKSSKAPTQSTFQLPGEAVAAKLKAAKEARLQKETEEQKKKVFKARPAPSMTSKPVVRQTSASKARESLMTGVKPTPAPSASHRRAASLASSRLAGRTSVVSKPTPSAGIAKKSSTPSFTQPISVPKRASTSMATLHRPRPSTALSSKSNPAGAAALGNRSNSTSKGKEVFNRAANAKNSAEQQKKEKEEAAKKARAEAAERSRALSREWAEKQKAKKADFRASVAGVPNAAGS
ncbi:uncharacterized protein MYCGRDRAFT_111542 [Zymoseptoria tritici IPO323]|uniref:Uncharacterized protein n=1 Tax=Zymoseptoria tritici (strain CBS 115943 / IPO323) TaxID=336722 RepID=F9XP47_ZYMTI|nr:uncharacterized protein MYCGRDRAFT_111542 [Zymoseptoria tritici IPO323]EGP82985.1 hypothetical protein MYCGRDRAFT_111542 [Zymoseptoria tritici IPO323]